MDDWGCQDRGGLVRLAATAADRGRILECSFNGPVLREDPRDLQQHRSFLNVEPKRTSYTPGLDILSPALRTSILCVAEREKLSAPRMRARENDVSDSSSRQCLT